MEPVKREIESEHRDEGIRAQSEVEPVFNDKIKESLGLEFPRSFGTESWREYRLEGARMFINVNEHYLNWWESEV